MIGLTLSELRRAFTKRIENQVRELERLEALVEPSGYEVQAMALLRRGIASSELQRSKIKTVMETQPT